MNAFTTSFNAAIQNFDQVRSSTQEAFGNFEKSVEEAMKKVQGQFSSASKPATKGRAK